MLTCTDRCTVGGDSIHGLLIVGFIHRNKRVRVVRRTLTGHVISLVSSPIKRKHKRIGMKTLSQITQIKFGKWVK